MYHAPGRWPTSDGVIPFRLFVAASAALRHFAAQSELQAAHASAYGAAIAFGGGKDPALARYTRRLVRAAFPASQ